MLHDEQVYPDPMMFKPERFLDEAGKINTKVQDPSMAAFGFGRRYTYFPISSTGKMNMLTWVSNRICPGRYFASDMAFITLASILAMFNVGPAIDEVTGVPIPVEEKAVFKIMLQVSSLL